MSYPITDDLLQMLGASSQGSVAGSGNSTYTTGSSSLNTASSPIGGGYLSEIESAILRSQVPIEINETEEITVLGHRGIWANKQEVSQWHGDLPIHEYEINEDQNPEILTKKSDQSLEYVQELAIRYLRPPTPPTPGEIYITQEANQPTAPAPPLIIRQQPPRAETPEPLVIREAPPTPPETVGRKVITISGKRLPPPPRKVIIERLAPLPSKPQNVIIERWLPYAPVKRRVIFNRSSAPEPIMARPRNVIVQWEAPRVTIRKEVKYLGVIRANPAEYVQKYGTSLQNSNQLPSFVLDIKTPDEVGALAADYKYSSVYELEGQLEGLENVDLEKEGLGEYRDQLSRLGIMNNKDSSSQSYKSSSRRSSKERKELKHIQTSSFVSNSEFSALTNTSSINSASASALVQQIFNQLDKNGSGKLSVEEANSIFIRINNRLGRSFSEHDRIRFFDRLDRNSNGEIDLNEFKRAFDSL